MDGSNTILVAGGLNHRVRMIVKEGSRVTPLAGSSQADQVDGKGASARFDASLALVMDTRWRLLLVDTANSGGL